MADIWLDTPNPFLLPPPPRPWQNRVYDYDKMLRVMPSQVDRVYRLCRVARRESRLGLDAMRIHEHPDTVAMIEQGVVPVATLYRFHDTIVGELQARDGWRFAPGKAHEALDEADAKKEAANRRAQDDEFAAVGGDAFRSLQYAKGERVSLRDVNRGRVGRPLNPHPVTVGGFRPRARRGLRALFGAADPGPTPAALSDS